MSRPGWAALLVVLAWACVEAALARRPDLDDHGRFAASLSCTEARNHVRWGALVRSGAPLCQGGAVELAREAPYLSQPVGDALGLAAWFEVFGVSVRAARARTVTIGVVALIALAVASRSALLPLAFGSIPIVVYYAHAAFPPFIGAAALAIAAAARFARLEGGGRAALVLQGVALVLAMATTWKGILFATVWLLADLRTRRRDGLIIFALAALLLVGELGYIVALGQLGEVVAKVRLRSGAASWLRVLRYGRGLGYAHVLLAATWGVLWLRGRTARVARGAVRDQVALELFLAPVPWFLVFRQRVSNHDHELLYFAPAVAFACWSVLEDLRARRAGALRVVLAAALLVGAGGWIGADLEHRDDFAEPREMGALVRELVPPDVAVATSSPEHSMIWEADRFVHLDVGSVAKLDALLAGEPRIAPRFFLLPARDAGSPLGAALAGRWPASRRGATIVFDLGNSRGERERSR